MKRIINILVTLIVAALVYYFTLPALNFHSIGIYIYIGFIAVFYGVISMINDPNVKLVMKGKQLRFEDNAPIQLFIIIKSHNTQKILNLMVVLMITTAYLK